jgi:hypothetical protein
MSSIPTVKKSIFITSCHSYRTTKDAKANLSKKNKVAGSKYTAK